MIYKKRKTFTLTDTDESIDFENDIDNSTPLIQRRTEPILSPIRPSPFTILFKSTLNKQNPFAYYSQFDGTVY